MVAPAGGVVSGQGYAINDAVVFAQRSAAAGELFPALVVGCVDLPKQSSLVIPAGRRLFWNDTLKRVSDNTLDGNRIGFSVNAAGNGTTTVRVLFYALS